MSEPPIRVWRIVRTSVDAPPRDQFPLGWAGKVSTDKDTPSPSQQLGHKLLIDGNALALRVPSVTIPGEFNYVINVEHPDFSKLVFSSPERFDFDDRVQRLVKGERQKMEFPVVTRSVSE